LIAKWLTAGVLEDGHLIETEEGPPQGAVSSPLLANIYLHYVYDQGVHQWRQRCATGEWVPQSSENGRQSTRSALVPPLPHVLIRLPMIALKVYAGA
jgi:retron-type reverse transcriptase